MDIVSLILIGIGLAMDATAVSIAKGMCIKQKDLFKYALMLGITFGLFQGLMPLLGYYLGHNFAQMISSIDHWIAFILLSLIGLNMIRESNEVKDETCDSTFKLPFKELLLLAIATSIDALAIGVSFAFLEVNIITAVLIIGIITCILSFIGVISGKKLGSIFEKYAQISGGVILIVLGIKILIEHLFF